MKKSILLFSFLLVVVNAYADQTLNGRQPREWDASSSENQYLNGKDYSDNTTAFANSVNTGNQLIGNPGYQALMACDSAGICRSYYLWVDATTSTGVLKMASLPALVAYSSFPYGDWRSGTGFQAGVKVSSQ